MTGFTVILDDLGIETRSASMVGKSQVLFNNANNKLQRYGAIGIEPISTQSTTSGTLKGAAWGLVLAGPLGVAIGSMVGGGMKVAFELQTLEGPILKCIAGKGAYLKIKKLVETRPATPREVKAPKSVLAGPRKVSGPLMAGVVLLPVVFFWFLLRSGHTGRDRLLGVVWLVIWCIGFANIPVPPDEVNAPPAATVATADGAS